MVLTNQLIFLFMRKIFSNYVCFSKSPKFTYAISHQNVNKMLILQDGWNIQHISSAKVVMQVLKQNICFTIVARLLFLDSMKSHNGRHILPVALLISLIIIAFKNVISKSPQTLWVIWILRLIQTYRLNLMYFIIKVNKYH